MDINSKKIAWNNKTWTNLGKSSEQKKCSSTPLKMNGWNLKFTPLERNIIFHPPPFLGFKIWVFPKIGVHQNGWFIMENPMSKWMIWGNFPLFLECHPYEFSRVLSLQAWSVGFLGFPVGPVEFQTQGLIKSFFLHGKSLGIQSYSQMMIGVSNHLLSIVFRFHYHSQKVIGSLGNIPKRSFQVTLAKGHRNQV